MGLRTRLELYEQLEEVRKRPLIVYITSSRENAGGGIGSDVIDEIISQLHALPGDVSKLDFLVASNGGDPVVAWHIVSLLRERVDELTAIIPRAAFSAATLIALGADSIIMHPHGNLGPVDPQITVLSKDQDGRATRFGSEDLAAFMAFAREEVGLTDQAHLVRAFEKFCDEVGAVPLGNAARSSRLMLSMGEKLLRMHMRDEGDEQKASTIAEKLNKEFLHHGYALGREEAKRTGLKIAERHAETEDLAWRIWLDVAEELAMQQPFNSASLLRESGKCDALFGDVLQWSIPVGLPAQAVQAVLAQVTSQAVVRVPPVEYKLTHAVLESTRAASRCTSEGMIFGSRLPTLELKLKTIATKTGWFSVPIQHTNEEGKITTVPAESLVGPNDDGCVKASIIQPSIDKETA